MTIKDLKLAMDVFVLSGYGGELVATEHDIIYGPGGDILDEGLRRTLEELHWGWDEELDCWYHFV